MKTTFLKHKILSIVVLLILSVSFHGCSDDNDEAMSFLENHADTKWKFSELGGTLYVKINNSQTNPFEIWISFLESGCFIHESINDDGTPEILENTKNKLVVKIVDNPQEYTIITFTVTGDTLTVLSEYFEDEVLDEEEIFILAKTSDNLDDLEICAF